MANSKAAFEFGYETGIKIDRGIDGIFATHDREKHGAIAQLVYEAGNGDHLEIGTLYGGSAILAAMTKQRFGLGGEVVCVDPFINSEIDKWIRKFTDVPVCPELVLENARKMGVSLTVHKMRSIEFEIDGQHFASAYIDGDHTYEGIRDDWVKVYPNVDKLVFFDDYYDTRFPGVKKFLDKVKVPGWERSFCGQIAVIRKARNG